MTNSDKAVTAVPISRPRVPPAKIQEELERIRSAAADVDSEREAAAKGSAAPRFKATLTNLILLSSAKTAEHANEIADALITEFCVQHPSRIFIAEFTDGPQTDALQTAVSSRCVLADSGVHLCSEEIYISVTKAAVPLVPNLLMSLFVPDVDIVTVLIGDPENESGAGSKSEGHNFHTLLAGISAFSRLLVYDSATFGSYATAATFFRDAEVSVANNTAADPARRMRIRDIVWQRTKRWRELLAECFDLEPLSRIGEHGAEGESASPADSIRTLRLLCRTDINELRAGRVPADAVLLVGWFITSLDLSLDGLQVERIDHGIAARIERPAGPIIFEFLELPVNFPGLEFTEHESLFGVNLDVIHSGNKFNLRLDRNSERRSAEIAIVQNVHEGTISGTSSPETAPRYLPFGVDSPAELLLAEMSSFADDELFLKARTQSIALAESLSGPK